MSADSKSSARLPEQDLAREARGSVPFSWRGMKRSCKGALIAILAFYLAGLGPFKAHPWGQFAPLISNVIFIGGWLIAVSGLLLHFTEFFQKWGSK